MNHTRFMCRLQRLRDLLGYWQGLIQRDRPLRDPVSERGPLDQLQDERPRPLGLLDAVDGGDVGMVEAGQDLRLPLEPGQAIGVAGEGVGRIFRATWRLSWVSVACQTWPMPPSPKSEVTS